MDTIVSSFFSNIISYKLNFDIFWFLIFRLTTQLQYRTYYSVIFNFLFLVSFSSRYFHIPHLLFPSSGVFFFLPTERLSDPVAMARIFSSWFRFLYFVFLFSLHDRILRKDHGMKYSSYHLQKIIRSVRRRSHLKLLIVRHAPTVEYLFVLPFNYSQSNAVKVRQWISFISSQSFNALKGRSEKSVEHFKTDKQ